MDRMGDSLNCGAVSQNDAIDQIGLLASLLREHFDQIQMFPQALHEIVQVQVHIAADYHCMRQVGEAIYFFNWDLIDFIIRLLWGKKNFFVLT